MLYNNLTRQKSTFDFLHEKGYTAYTIPGLTYIETDFLVAGHNVNVKKKNAANKKAAKKR